MKVNEEKQPFCWAATSTVLGHQHCASDSGAVAFCKKTVSTRKQEPAQFVLEIAPMLQVCMAWDHLSWRDTCHGGAGSVARAQTDNQGASPGALPCPSVGPAGDIPPTCCTCISSHTNMCAYTHEITHTHVRSHTRGHTHTRPHAHIRSHIHMCGITHM